MSNAEHTVQKEFIKWGFFVVIGLIGAGLVSLANRNVYSKEQVDSKFEYHNEVQRLQNQLVLDKLEVIADDVAEIKQEKTQ